jgi:hypothetical protein
MGELVDTLAEQALQQGQLEGMLEWWRSLPDDANDGSARQAAVGQVLMRLEEADRDRAQAWLAELAATPYRNDGRIGHFAERLAANDPAGAVAWVASLSPGSDGHYIAIGRTIRAWTEKDKTSADRWVASLPPSPLRDQAMEAQQQTLVNADIFLGDSHLNQAIQYFQGGVKMQIKLNPQDGPVQIFERK